MKLFPDHSNDDLALLIGDLRRSVINLKEEMEDIKTEIATERTKKEKEAEKKADEDATSWRDIRGRVVTALLALPAGAVGTLATMFVKAHFHMT